MSTWFVDLGIASNEVAAVVAQALLREFDVNAFSFSGFPAVAVASDHKEIFLTLELGELKTTPLAIAFAEAKRLVLRYREGHKSEDALFLKVQKLVVELERLDGGRTRKG